MAGQLVKHGSQAGYRAELEHGKVCERCRRGHLVYNKQYTRTGKKLGLKYGANDVVDHLFTKGKVGAPPGNKRAGQGASLSQPPGEPPGELGDYTVGLELAGQERAATGQQGPSLADRIRGIVLPGNSDEYVPDNDVPDYLHSVEPDDEPDESGWSQVTDDEYVITAAGLKKIQENLGTYLSVIGMTAEMVDPYCGAIAAENFDNMVDKWSKVVAKYPKAAQLFLDTKGGTLFAWIGAIQATWPVLFAMYEHHFAKTVKIQNGKIMRQTMNGQVDATMPPQPDNYNYTAG